MFKDTIKKLEEAAAQSKETLDQAEEMLDTLITSKKIIKIKKIEEELLDSKD